MPNVHAMALVSALSVTAALIAFVVADMPVSRKRVQRFVHLHDIHVTTANGAQIIAYLARTRRWRAAGLVSGLTAYTVIDLQHSRASVNIMYLVAGWFVGALAAEVHMAGPPVGKRAASLAPRTLDRYLARPARRALSGSVLAVLALAAVVTAQTQDGRGRTVVSLAVAAVVTLPVSLTTQRVRQRPQPLAAPDVLAADDAIRSRSLHALTASGVTLLLYCAADPLLRLIAVGSTRLAVVVTLICAVGIPWWGWRLATTPWVVQTGR
jgi:hypothetical protein